MIPSHADLVEFLASIESFRELEAPALRAIAEKLELQALPPGSYLLRQGQRDDNLYCVVSGALAVTAATAERQERYLTTIERGEAVGGLGLLASDESAIDVCALSDARVAKFSQKDFRAVAGEFADVLPQMMQVVTRRFRTTRLLWAVHVSQLFGELDEVALRDLEAELEIQLICGGEVLMKQGEAGDFLCIVISGRLRVVREDADGHMKQIAELGAGEIVGEMALVSGEPRSATVYAIRDTELARLSRAGFERFAVEHPQLAVQTFTKQMILRLRDQISGAPVRGRAIATLAIVSAGPNRFISQFAESLVVSLSKLGTTLHLMGARLDALFHRSNSGQTPENAASSFGIGEWLSKQEMDFSYVVYEADAALTPWTRRCLRQADHILLVGDAAESAAGGKIEGQILATLNPTTGTRKTLVLIHENPAAAPAGTIDWLVPRDVQRHFHVRLTSPGDYDRLARTLLGRATGLVLGGGFARGYAHLGVIRAMKELGIEIDAIGGCSMGALLAGAFALGVDEETLLRETTARGGKFFNDVTLPFVSLQRGGKLGALLQELLGSHQIEDLRVPFFCVSSNLNRAELKVHTRGELRKAVLTSTRAPVIFPPIVYDGDLHVDGGLLNNVPVDVMRRFCNDGIVIGVDVSPPVELDPIDDYGLDVNGWRAFWHRVRPFDRPKTPIPTMMQIVMRTIEFGGLPSIEATMRMADLYLRPPLVQFKRGDFNAAREIADVGYRFAIEKIGEWQRSFKKDEKSAARAAGASS